MYFWQLGSVFYVYLRTVAVLYYIYIICIIYYIYVCVTVFYHVHIAVYTYYYVQYFCLESQDIAINWVDMALQICPSLRLSKMETSTTLCRLPRPIVMVRGAKARPSTLFLDPNVFSR